LFLPSTHSVKTTWPKYKEIKTQLPWATQWYETPSERMVSRVRLSQPQKSHYQQRELHIFPLLLPSVHPYLTSCMCSRDHRRTRQVRSACRSSWKLNPQKGEGLVSWTKVVTTGHVIPNTCTREGVGPCGWSQGEGRAPLSTKA